MFLNSGSSDAGLDPDWDAKEKRWKGFDRWEEERRNKKS
jgi:hypothetical protein